MSRKIAKRFKDLSIDQFLYQGLSTRFLEVSSHDFLDFVALTLEQLGYHRVQKGYSADFGADLMVSRDGQVTAVVVRKFFELHKVDISDIRQILSARDYYGCDQSMVVTTSTYTPAARKLADQESVLLWDWKSLIHVLSDVYLDGQPHEVYFEPYLKANAEAQSAILELSIAGEPTVHPAEITVELILRNKREEPVHINCEPPVIITRIQRQYQATKWEIGSFAGGYLHGHAQVSLTCVFDRKQVASIHADDRIVLTIHLIDQNKIIVLEAKPPTMSNGQLIQSWWQRLLDRIRLPG